MIKITLNQKQIDWCKELGYRRSASKNHADTKNSRNLSKDKPAWYRHFIGVCGEFAYAQHTGQKVDTNISLSEDHMEISIIKYLLEQPNILNDVLKFIDSSMFEYHSIEFDMLINDKDNTKLRGYLLNDKIKSLNNSQLDNLIFILLSKSYDSKITKIKYDENLTFRQKSKLLRDTTNIQKHLKSQKFIS